MLRETKKHGLGHLVKFKTVKDFQNTSVGGFPDSTSFIDRLDKSNFHQLIQQQIQICSNSVSRVRGKVDKLRNQLKGKGGDAPWFSRLDYSSSHLKRKCTKMVRLSATVTSQYFGEFEEDLRHGVGICFLPPSMNSNLYRGGFEKDKPYGRGIYIFNTYTKAQPTETLSSQSSGVGACLYYIGEFKDGVAEGKGKVVADGMRYEGGIRMGQMHCEHALVEYDNGDVYKGGVSQAKKSDKQGSYTYFNGDKYAGPFFNDAKHTDVNDPEGSKGTLSLSKAPIKYTGAFRNDIKTGPCTIEFGEEAKLGKFTGELDENEELTGTDCVFTFPVQNVTYEGDFAHGRFSGRGKLTHHETGNIFEGEFLHGEKHGEATFTLANLKDENGKQREFKGRFEHNMELKQFSEYGPRF